MFELLKIANDNNVNVDIKVLDGAYRPLVGEIVNIITFTKVDNPINNKQIIILKTDSDTVIQEKINYAMSKLEA
jgi:hypothetical protein